LKTVLRRKLKCRLKKSASFTGIKPSIKQHWSIVCLLWIVTAADMPKIDAQDDAQNDAKPCTNQGALLALQCSICWIVRANTLQEPL
jgi:hypothetical protein